MKVCFIISEVFLGKRRRGFSKILHAIGRVKAKLKVRKIEPY